MRRLIFFLVLLCSAAWAQQTQVASDTLENTACSSSCGSGGTLGANWKQYSGLGISESVSGVTGGSSNNGYFYNDQAAWVGTGSFGNDMYSQVNCVGSNNVFAARTCGVSVRATGSFASQSNTTGYMFYFTSDGSGDGGGTYTLYKTSAGTSTSLGSTAASGVGTTLTLNLQVTGSTLVAKAGSTTIFNVTDTLIATGGAPGFLANLTGTFYAQAWSGGTAVSSPTVATPTSSLATGSYTMPQTGVTLSDGTSGATICYMLNGGTPTAATAGTCDSQSGTEFTYSSSLTISATTTLTILGTKTGDINSAVATYTYTQSTVANPTASNGSGTYNNTVSETLSDSTGGSTILYCTDTTNTCTPSTTYSSAFNVNPSSGVTVYLRLQATETGYTSSSIVSYNLTFTVAVISASPVAGTYSTAQSVTLSTASTGAVIHYRTDGTAAACSDTTYSSAISVPLTATVTAIGCQSNYNNSAAFSALYTITIVASPTASPAATGSFVTLTVTLADVTSGSTILYCIDTVNSCTPASTYSTTLSVSSTEYIRAQGTKTAYTSSSVVSFYYQINPADQTGSYAFSDNFQNYYTQVYATGSGMPLDSWNSQGLWTATAAESFSSLILTPDTIVGGSAVMTYSSQSIGVIYTGATGWDASGSGQYSKAYLHTTSSGCVIVQGATSHGYYLCDQGTAISLSRDGGSVVIASATITAPANGSSLELRWLNGVLQPLLNGSAISGFSATYSDSTYTTGNPGISGNDMYNWSGGTIAAASAPSPITFGGVTWPTYGPYSWTSSNNTASWPFAAGSSWPQIAAIVSSAPNTTFTGSGSVVTLGSTLNPGTSASVQISGAFPTSLNGSYVPTSSNSSSFQISSSTTASANSSITEAGTTVTLCNSSLTAALGTVMYVAGVTPSGYNGLVTVTGGFVNCPTYTAASSLGTVSVLGTAIIPGMASKLSSSSSAVGINTAAGIVQNLYLGEFLPAQWMLTTIAIDTTNSGVRNWFMKLQSGNAILGGAGCYDWIAYYLGVEPMYSISGTPPNPVTCTATAEYCGTNWLHITKATPATSTNPLGTGCTGTPNYNVVTVSGSSYIPMEGDQILYMYEPNGYLDAYCLGTAHSASAPFGGACPSTTHFYRVIHAYDTDMQTPMWGGQAQGVPGIWGAITSASVPIPVFSAIEMGSVSSGVTCASITGSSCISPTSFIEESMVP